MNAELKMDEGNQSEIKFRPRSKGTKNNSDEIYEESSNEENMERIQTKPVMPSIMPYDGIQINLMEQLLILSLNETQGYQTIWNDCLSVVLRGCLLIELALLGRIELDGSPIKKTSASNRHLIIKDSSLTEDFLLDTALKLLKEYNESESVSEWLSMLTGETWNPTKIPFQIKRFRERISKQLVEKDILIPINRNYFFFGVTNYEIRDLSAKNSHTESFKTFLIKKWNGDLFLHDVKIYSLIILSYYANITETIFMGFTNEEYSKCCTIIKEIVNIDFDEKIKTLYLNPVGMDQTTLKKIETVLAVLQALSNR